MVDNELQPNWPEWNIYFTQNKTLISFNWHRIPNSRSISQKIHFLLLSLFVVRERRMITYCVEEKKTIKTILINLHCKYFEWFSSETENWNIFLMKWIWNSILKNVWNTSSIFTFRFCRSPSIFHQINAYAQISCGQTKDNRKANKLMFRHTHTKYRTICSFIDVD